MKSLQVVNAVVAAAGASLGLVLAVVGVIYSFYIADVPRLRDEFCALLLLSLGFWAVAGAAALAYLGQKRHSTWRWVAQATPIIPLALIIAYIRFSF